MTADPKRLARFEREVRVLSLNHPNIATLHGYESEGDTLAERISRWPITVEEATPLFAALADGLEAAHPKGIVHRDLKPANDKLGVLSASAAGADHRGVGLQLQRGLRVATPAAMQAGAPLSRKSLLRPV